MQYISTSEKQTFNFAKNFAHKLKGGEIIGLIGELGAGKTIFVKGLADGLSIKKNITSPTFVLIKVYQIQNSPATTSAAGQAKSKIQNLIHIDAYRIKSPQDIIAIGAQEYFYKPNTIVIIEWADKIKKILPKTTRFVNLINKDNNKRLINY